MDRSGETSARTRRFGRNLRVAAGFASATVVIVAIGEAALRAVPPRSIAPYLQEDETPGPFRSDPVYGVQYKSWDAFHADYAKELKPHETLFTSSEPPRTWAMFGSSFVHSGDMLADTTRKHVPNRHVFNLGRNEHVYVRAAQIELLLEYGLRPERILFALMPLDIAAFARQGFAHVHAGKGGALAYDPQVPNIGGAVVVNSRLALAGWVRAEMQNSIPFFKPGGMTRRMDSRVLAESRYLFEQLGRVSQLYHVPMTILLIPNWEQITKGEPYAFQDALQPLATDAGLDVLDVRDPFRSHPNKPALFIPDKHFSDIGNRILLNEFVKHLHSLGEASDVKLPEGFAK